MFKKFTEFTLPGLLWDPVVQLETALALLAAALSFLCRRKPALFAWADHLGTEIASRRRVSLLWIFLGALLLHTAVAPFLPRREPAVHDEFSYLLAADTVLHGRAANPPHPLWEHFEAVHIISLPTYSSMYPPAQGLVLAVGKLITGHYLAGAWIATALLCSLLYWMLLGWVPPRWALLGTFLATVRIGLFSYWANGYWGGSHAALGGVLLLGSVPRLVRNPRKKEAALASLGLLILMNSRPFEGLFFSLSCLALFFWRFRGNHRRAPLKRYLTTAVPVALLILLPGILATGYMHKKVTGRWTSMPQQENMRRYGLAVLPWQSMQAERVPRVKHMQAFYEGQRQIFRNFRTLPGFFASKISQFGKFWSFYTGSLFALPLLCFFIHWRRWRNFQFLSLGAMFGIAYVINPWFFPHYFAPAVGWLFLVLIQSLRGMFLWRRNGAAPGRLYVRALPLIAAFIAMFNLYAGVAELRRPTDDYSPAWHNTPAGNVARAILRDDLRSQPGKHLVLVQYGSNHDPLVDWVYNEADIDASRIVWAHDLGEEANKVLLRYYSDRRAWRINVDSQPLRLEPMEGMR